MWLPTSKSIFIYIYQISIGACIEIPILRDSAGVWLVIGGLVVGNERNPKH